MTGGISQVRGRPPVVAAGQEGTGATGNAGSLGRDLRMLRAAGAGKAER